MFRMSTLACQSMAYTCSRTQRVRFSSLHVSPTWEFT